MVKLYQNGAFLIDGKIYERQEAIPAGREITKDEGRLGTIAYGILKSHNTSDNMEKLRLRFDCMASHDITYVGIVQTARASGLESFPIPYVLTNCHNSLCAVGGTINEDDHVFGLSAAKKYGGIYVPMHQAVIHQYMREMMAGCGRMILGSDSHTRYGALGTLAIGEGGGELAKQLLGKTYDLPRPEVVGVYLAGKPDKSVGPMDVALAIIKATFKNGFVKNKIMEFVGDGIKNLNAEFRGGIDVMTTETTCLSSVWATDGVIAEYYKAHGRKEAYHELRQPERAYYDGFIYVDLAKIRPMIAMPFHPSNVYTIAELNENLADIVHIVEREANAQLENSAVRFAISDKIKDGRIRVDQGVIAGCAGGTFDNICDATDILGDGSIGTGEFSLAVYPASQPTFYALTQRGVISRLMLTGTTVRSAFCGPCFGAGDVPANNGFSVRHTTRNFPNREGSKPSAGQIASVALMDARSIAATAKRGGVLTSAAEVEVEFSKPEYFFDSKIYENRVYLGFGKADRSAELKLGPSITDWPEMPEMPQNLLLRAAAMIFDEVTTTDELIPSGETSSYRSNPLALAEFTLSRKDPHYVARAKRIHLSERARLKTGELGDIIADNPELFAVFRTIGSKFQANSANSGIGSFIYARKPGDGSAREQAASCQRVLGGYANIAAEYATKRYRSNLINWGVVPFLLDGEPIFGMGDYIFVPNVREGILNKAAEFPAYLVKDGALTEFTLKVADMTDGEREILAAGCLINYYR